MGDPAPIERERAPPPPVRAEPGWQPVDPFRIEGGRGSFVSGDPEGDTLRVAYFRRDGDLRLVGRAWFGPGTAGPPGHAHGGSMAAVLDEAMGAAAWLAGHIAVAVHLETEFRAMLPLGTDATLEAWVERRGRRKVWTAGSLRGDDGTLYAEARALFLRLDADRDRALLERAAAAMHRDVDELLAAVRALGSGASEPHSPSAGGDAREVTPSPRRALRREQDHLGELVVAERYWVIFD